MAMSTRFLRIDTDFLTENNFLNMLKKYMAAEWPEFAGIWL
jgi:hypothetical protein